MYKQEDFQFTHMDGVSLVEINKEKKRVAKDVLDSELSMELSSYLDYLPSLDDFDCEFVWSMLHRILEEDLHLSPGGLHEAIGRIITAPVDDILEYTTQRLTICYKEYHSEIKAADESLIYTQKWLEELAKQRNDEDFATEDFVADDFFALEMSEDKDTLHDLPTPSKRYVSTLDYIKGQQLFNDKI